MTTYELPPEPPIGSRVRDHHGHVWTHTNDGWIHPDLRSSGLSWGAVMAYASPAELIEPDPWPTADLLAWRGMLWAPIAGSESGTPRYYAIHEGDEVWESMDSPFRSEAIPVTVVPVAELDALRASIKALGYGPQDTRGMTGSLLDTALRLLDATDALGVDL